MLHLCIATLATADPFAGLNWRSIGPAVLGGRLGAVAGSDVDSSLYYVGAAGGGVWKSTNAGAAIAIDADDTTTVWVGSGESNPRNEVTQGDGVYNDFLPDVLRERLQSQLDTYFDSLAPATAAQRAEDAALHALTRDRLDAFAKFAEQVRAVDAQLKASSLAPVDE